MTDGLKSSISRIDSGLSAGLDSRAPAATPADKAAFKEALKGAKASVAVPETQVASQANSIKFSNHAVERMQKRGISPSPELKAKMEAALQKAAEKGAKETLMLTDEAAYIVNVKNKTVVTAMDLNSLKENVFTNIDSTVML